MISRCNSPRKPQRKPKPRAAEVSISKEKLASLSRNFPIAARRLSKSSASTGNRPQNTTGIAGLNPGNISITGFPVVGNGVADAGVGHFLDRGGNETDLAGAQFLDLLHLRGKKADALDLVSRVGAHHPDALTFLQHAVDDPNQHHHAEIDVIPAVDQKRL